MSLGRAQQDGVSAVPATEPTTEPAAMGGAMLAALALEFSIRLRRMLWAALVIFAAQSPREKLFAIVVLVVVAIDFGIPIVTFGCLSWGHCPFLHP